MQEPPYSDLPTEDLQALLEGLDSSDELTPYYASELADELSRRPQGDTKLEALLRTGTSVVRMAALRPLATTRAAASAAAHARRLLDDHDGLVVAEAIDLLAETAAVNDGAHETILGKEEDSSSLVRGAVVRYAARRGFSGARELIERRALDVSPRVRQNVADELAGNDALWAQELRAGLRDDHDPDVRDAATSCNRSGD